MDLISVVIPTYNRFKYVLNTIDSIQKQTYSNIEIIVVNDCSTQKEYYEYDWKNIKIIHLEKNSKQIFGYACAGYVRNEGIKIANGKYIAFCDDDDIWFPEKLQLQIEAMLKTGCKMSSTEGLYGDGVYNSKKQYSKLLNGYYYNLLQKIYKDSKFLENGFPNIWNYDFLRINNCIITSSVLIEKEILEKINFFNLLKNGQEDYNCWLRALNYTNNVFIENICVYYDGRHGDGINY